MCLPLPAKRCRFYSQNDRNARRAFVQATGMVEKRIAGSSAAATKLDELK
jgi:hypothetical protein